MKNVFVWVAGVAVVLVACSRPVVAGDQAKVPCSTVVSTAVPAKSAVVEGIPDPVEHATQLLEVLGKERQARMAARDRLSKDGASVEQKLAEIRAELGRINRDLELLHCHVGKGCYPFCLNGVQICNRAHAVRTTSTLMARSLALQAAVNLLEKNLQDGQNETDQIIAGIDSLEASIVLVPYQTSRIMVQQLPSDSIPLLEKLNAMLPKESAEIAAHKVRVAAFLAGPLPGESQTAETPAVPEAEIR
ncbi:MAG: hypothetical protein ACKO2P_02435 [Planctomycetota bacterium]